LNCPNCSCTLKLDSLEYRWHGDQIIAKSSYSCPYCYSLWVKSGKELVRAIPLTELTK
jgi:hypothetical protein